MNRRIALQWISRMLAAAVTLLVAIPGVQYVLATVRPAKGRSGSSHRVALLKVLKKGVPFQVAIIDQRRDAWTVYPAQMVGRAYLVRRTDDETPPEKAVVDAYSTICPHLGCTVDPTPDQTGFHCPCHGAAFNLQGAVLSGPSPRPMESLDAKVVSADGDWWVQVNYI